MKQFNFLNSVPQKTQKDFKIWYKFSVIFFSVLLLFLGCVSLKQIIKLSTLKKELFKLKELTGETDQNILTTKIETQENQNLEKQVKKLSKWKNPKVIPVEILNDISNIIPDDISLTEISYKYKQQITIRGTAKSIIAVKDFMYKLKQTDWANSAQLVKVEQDKSTNQNLSYFELVIK